jgi:hypothetical protein
MGRRRAGCHLMQRLVRLPPVVLRPSHLTPHKQEGVSADVVMLPDFAAAEEPMLNGERDEATNDPGVVTN